MSITLLRLSTGHIFVISAVALAIVISFIVKDASYEEIKCRKKLTADDKESLGGSVEYVYVRIYQNKKTGINKYMATSKENNIPFVLDQNQIDEIESQILKGEEYPELTF